MINNAQSPTLNQVTFTHRGIGFAVRVADLGKEFGGGAEIKLLGDKVAGVL